MRGVFMIMALALPTAASCGQQQSAADRVADQFLADDRQKVPTDPTLAKDLEFLQTCSAKRIRGSDIHYGDSEDAINAKVQTAMKQCTDDLYAHKKP